MTIAAAIKRGLAWGVIIGTYAVIGYIVGMLIVRG